MIEVTSDDNTTSFSSAKNSGISNLPKRLIAVDLLSQDNFTVAKA
jgi:hypothetical protein